ncbi:hypothetical protein [Paenibacillus radicis (ex Gao et al. 2016)]|uniref:Leucine-rich repeat domain-containing protein n=1 Tax=Paenibacillus radicis (ex Gao et al. 2016) TaxID=1737354 RepID=A0A917H7P5_9BACL|nr:hypothetical protein [Paenibacillus radicis (ex Gao et al. 2016)]GGG69744.1 hypothetical protein GCM10010918_26210 [Paenibacillus radicis (ex Gao et al. 2016)]
MRKKWKRRILINDPVALDRVQIKQDLSEGNQVIVQFSHPDFYGSILEEVDELCARLDENFGVRFYGHKSLSFDGRTLLRIPHVKMLHLNALVQAHNTETLAELGHLYSLHLGIYELENSEILGIESLQSLRELTFFSDKKLINLQYFKEFSHLQHLHIGGKVKNLDAIGHLEDLDYLALHSISKLPLHFINRLKKLKHLRILLGGREHIQEIEENEIDDLELVRIRGFHDLSNITKFRALTSLRIEDQAKLQEIGFDRGMEALEEITLSNCKGLAHLLGIEQLPSLRKLRIMRTAIDFDSFISQELPSALSEVEFTTSKSKADQAIEGSLLKLGYHKWSI